MIERIKNYQPATWWSHTGVSLLTWWAGSLISPQLGAAAALICCLCFGIREGANVEYHNLKGHNKLRWGLDMAGDLAGPVAVATQSLVPWGTDLPLLIGAAFLGVLTLVWTALYGGGES